MPSFNCECVDQNDNLTLAQYRTRMLQRLGFAAVAANPPPGMAALLTTFLQDAQNFLYLKYPALRTRRFFRWTMVENERFYGLRENDENWTVDDVSIDQNGTITFTSDAPLDGRTVYFTPPDSDPNVPSGIVAYQHYYIVGSSGPTSGFSLTLGGEPITEGLEAGTAKAHYSPATTCIFNFEPYKNIEGAWIVDLNGLWTPMRCGIPPVLYTTAMQPTIPYMYEIRQCIEVFPAPNVSGYQLYIKGEFGLAAFEGDDDKPTMDGNLVYLWAMANALEYYAKPSNAMWEQAREHLGSLVAGTHTGKRYVPGVSPLAPAVMPRSTAQNTP